MTAQKGSAFLLKVGNNGSPESFTTVGGMRTNNFILNNTAVDATNKDSGAWRALLEGAGIRSVNLSGTGIFTDSNAEETVRGYAFGNVIRNYQVVMGNGDVLQGPFQITRYERAADYNDAENYTLTLESAGLITFTTA